MSLFWKKDLSPVLKTFSKARKKDDDFYEQIVPVLRKCLDKQKQVIENMSILKPYSFVLEDDDKESIAELFVVDDDVVIIDPDLMEGLDKDLDDFLDKLLAD